MKQIDTRGFSCPQPLVMVTKVIKEDKESFEVLIDDETACENILRTLDRFNLKPEIRKENDHTIFKISR